MNFRIFSSILFAGLLAWSGSAFSQSNGSYTQDELARLSFSVHLLTYNNVNSFETAKGEAYFKTMLHAFEHGIVLPQLDMTDISSADQKIISDYTNRLKAISVNIPDWNTLLQMEETYQKFLDRSLRRQSKYTK